MPQMETRWTNDVPRDLVRDAIMVVLGIRFMGTILTISVIADLAGTPTVFAELATRLFMKKDWIHARIDGHGPLSARNMRSSDILAQLDTLLPELLPSLNALTLTGATKLASGATCTVNLDFYGKRYGAGWPVRRDGHIRITLPYKKRIPQALDRYTVRLDYDVERRTGTKTLTDAEFLFLNVCGLLSGGTRSNPINHAAMYLETGWPAGDSCAMVYHRNIEHFADEFSRIFAEYHWGILPPMILLNKIDVWQLSDDERQALSVIDPPHRNEAGHMQPRPTPISESRTHVLFRENLNASLIQAVSLLSTSKTRSILRRAHLMAPTVHWYDYDEHGGVLVADPVAIHNRIGFSVLGDMWQAFDFFAQQAMKAQK